MAAREITIGERSYTVPPFKFLKGLVAGWIVSQVIDEAQLVLDAYLEWRREFGEKNKLRITREMAHQRMGAMRDAAAQVTENPDLKASLETRAQSWQEQADRMGEQGYIELPGEPSEEQVALFIFSKGFDLAEREVKELLGLFVIKNGDLNRARQQVHVEGEEHPVRRALQEIGEEITAEGDIGEVIGLVTLAAETVEQELAKQREALGKLQGLRKRAQSMLGLGTEEEPEEEPTLPEPEQIEPDPETPSTPDSPTLSESSPSTTDGPSETSSPSAGETVSVT